jgi:hypothetical protein
MTADLKGGYYWVARMRNGETVEQRRRDGSEISVERLRTDPRPLAQLHLIPISPKHPYIILEQGEGEEFIKHWTFSEETGSRGTRSWYVDVLGLRPLGRSRKPVRVYVLVDGSLRITTALEEEGHYSEKPPGYDGPYPFLEDVRYKTVRSDVAI